MIRKVFRVLARLAGLILLAVVIGSAISYVMIKADVPKLTRSLRGEMHSFARMEAGMLMPYGMDTRVSYLTRRGWSKVCLFKKPFDKTAIEQKYANGFDVQDAPPSRYSGEWMMLFMLNPLKQGQWTPPCHQSKCFPISHLQPTEGCYSSSSVLRSVITMDGEKAVETRLLLTEPQDNLPNPRNKGGDSQNYLKIDKIN